jgi:dihydroorotate dehydrogenase (NAD+) catalytic subunit
MAFDPRRPGVPCLGGGERSGDEAPGRGSGGVSGPAVRAVALAQVAEVRARVEVPIVGMGGLQTGRQARDMLEAGADVVAVGTESFRDPMAGERVAAELAESLANSGIAPPEHTRAREPIAHNA